MRKILFTAILLTSSFLNAQNSLLEADFWKKNPDISMVEVEIKKGNNPSEANKNNFDPTALAINNNASLETILFLIKHTIYSLFLMQH